MKKIIIIFGLFFFINSFSQEKEVYELADKYCELLHNSAIDSLLFDVRGLGLNDSIRIKKIKEFPNLKVIKNGSTTTIKNLYKKEYPYLSDEKIAEKIVKNYIQYIIFNCDEFTNLTRKYLPKPDDNPTLLKAKIEVDSLLKSDKNLAANEKTDIIFEYVINARPSETDPIYQNNRNKLFEDLMNYFSYQYDDFYKQHSWSFIEIEVLDPILNPNKYKNLEFYKNTKKSTKHK